MRSRLILQLISAIVLVVLIAMGARACTTSSKSSPLNPAQVVQNGVSAICSEQAEQEAGVEAGGSDDQATPQTVASPSQLAQLASGNPAGAAALKQALGGSLNCPTTTTTTP